MLPDPSSSHFGPAIGGAPPLIIISVVAGGGGGLHAPVVAQYWFSAPGPSGENFPDPLDLRHPIVRTNAKLLRRAYLTRVVLALDGA
jgi:hypothetical protein